MLPERLKRRVIYESDWIDLYADTVRMPDGSIIEPYHVLHYPHNSVSVVIYNNKDEILMLRSKRYTAGGLEWEIPAGRVEKNESPEDAARRETDISRTKTAVWAGWRRMIRGAWRIAATRILFRQWIPS